MAIEQNLPGRAVAAEALTRLSESMRHGRGDRPVQ
jgi:hypothetical protein